ncbi:MAG: homoserine dehydrogenase [bacterium]
MKKKINVGLIGFGTIGTGVIKLLYQNASLIEARLGTKIILKKIADLDIESSRGVTIDMALLTKDAYEIITDPDIDIVIELMGGYEPALSFILKAIENGKNVVTANKALLSKHSAKIIEAAYKTGVELGFEASVGGGIPIIKSIKESLVANNILSIYGIINGTANYILSRMTEENRPFQEILEEAQKLGYAEANPSLDIDGIDSAHKLAILASLAFGINVDFDNISIEGIRNITSIDTNFANDFGYKIKLLAITKKKHDKIELRVHPTMLPNDYLLSTVSGVYNAIYVVGDASGPQMFYGKGAGELPTASAVVGDIVDIARNILTNSRGGIPILGYQRNEITNIPVLKIDELSSLYYLRFSVIDSPGTLSKIAGILGNHNISIASVIQKGRNKESFVPIVMMTHEARDKDVKMALSEIDNLPIVLDKTVLIRVEKGE